MARIARFDRIDSLRGLAIVWMTVYHFWFDLDYFGWVDENFTQDPLWTVQRTLIVALFLLCAGAGQAVAVLQGQSWQRFGRRWAQVAGAALLVSLGSWWMYPQTFIYFGVLHGMAVMLLIVRLTAHWGAWLWLAGILAMASPWVAAAAIANNDSLLFLNEKAFNWLGWILSKPRTEDYVPLFPWLGVMWWGVAATQALLVHNPLVLTGAIPWVFRPLAWLGTWSLLYYLLHQPVMLGVLQMAHMSKLLS